MLKVNGAITAAALVFGLAATPVAFAEDKNATQTNSGPVGQVTHGDTHSVDHSKEPATTAAPTQTNSGPVGQVTHGDTHLVDHSKEPAKTAAPTQTNSGPVR
jgi:hypothetical protein